MAWIYRGVKMDIEDFVNGVVENARKNIPRNPEDYVQDGLLYCGKCHTPKQGRYECAGKTYEPFILCRCESERYKADEEAFRERQRQDAIERRRRVAFPDGNMREWTFENDDKSNNELSRAARNYVEHFETFRKMGKGLLLYGSVGTGKTYAAACIANALIDKGYSAFMTTFARIENTIFALDDKQAYYDSLNEYDLLVLDDFGVERNTEYKQEIVYTVIDNRNKAGRPLIITSNITVEQLKNPKSTNDARIISRLYQMCHPVIVRGEDRRRQQIKGDYAEIQKLLGV